eukprot:NODE_6095_length_471_cov_27.445498_g4601_i0.p1 GENE.NODE_6095_length_471_cov_27.445498_g4601_i0~~NODE_6095_length_471_cov_27.445498_g4601_i0.p1  ORF type:complete len:64 (+),score=20.58 NODE_6095_length_471_cov_27.445498_g4601_i0:32-193(+)
MYGRCCMDVAAHMGGRAHAGLDGIDVFFFFVDLVRIRKPAKHPHLQIPESRNN